MHAASKIIVATLLVIATIGADGQTLRSTFDSGNEGWRGVRLGNDVTFTPILQGPFVPNYHATTGNPGGTISIADVGNPSSLFWFSAPAGFLGDQSLRYGGTIRWNHRYTYSDPYQPPVLTLPDIALIGAGLVLVGDAGVPANNPGTWASLSIMLRETNAWHIDNLTNRAPTEAEFRAVLGNLETLYVLGEYVGTQDTGYLDNFEMTGGRFIPIMSIKVASVEVCWTTQTNQMYQVQYRDQLTTNNWADFGTPRAGTGEIDCITDTSQGYPQRLYRVIELP